MKCLEFSGHCDDYDCSVHLVDGMTKREFARLQHFVDSTVVGIDPFVGMSMVKKHGCSDRLHVVMDDFAWAVGPYPDIKELNRLAREFEHESIRLTLCNSLHMYGKLEK